MGENADTHYLLIRAGNCPGFGRRFLKSLVQSLWKHPEKFQSKRKCICNASAGTLIYAKTDSSLKMTIKPVKYPDQANTLFNFVVAWEG